eukprot:PITA_26588
MGWFGGYSDHSLIFLEIEDYNVKPSSPFKFNATWMDEADFHDIVRKNWIHYSLDIGPPPVVVIENSLARFKQSGLTSYASLEEKEQLIKLERDNIRLLRQKEESWHLKRRALWLKAVNENTKIFQQFSRGRKSINMIWELKDHLGREASSFIQHADMGVRHFSNIYKASRGTSIAEILCVAKAMPSFIEEDEVEALNLSVSLGELESALKFFNKDKSSGSDGLPMEFYIFFFDLIG